MPETLEEYAGRCKAALKTLNDLGSAEAIADHLGTMGIKGIPGHSRGCPVARYVRLVCPSDRYFFRLGGSAWWVVEDLGVDVDAYDCCGLAPPNIKAFTQRFDLGDFPGLRQ